MLQGASLLILLCTQHFLGHRRWFKSVDAKNALNRCCSLPSWAKWGAPAASYWQTDINRLNSLTFARSRWAERSKVYAHLQNTNMDLEAKQILCIFNEVKGHEITTLLASKQYHMSCRMTIMGLMFLYGLSAVKWSHLWLTISIFVCQ